jgi:hypothetical protein
MTIHGYVNPDGSGQGNWHARSHDIYVAIESCGCVAGATTLRRPDAVADFLREMQECPTVTVQPMPVEEFRVRPIYCGEHPGGPPHWPSNQAVSE